MTYLVTGGAGFFGGILKRRLLAQGHRVVSIDLEEDHDVAANLVSVRGDIRDRAALARLFDEHAPEGVFHCAAILAHDAKDRRFLWSSNVDGTANVAAWAERKGVRGIVYTSSNCVYARNFDAAVDETVEPCPAEIYGRSKLEGERILARAGVRCVTLRTPTIVDEGRLGLLAILFEFIAEGRRVWVVGRGDQRYQFLCAQDLADACLRAMDSDASGVLHVGSSRVRTMREVFASVCERAATGARVASLPRAPTLWAMRLAHALGLSPLGPYQYRMIASNSVFDTTRARTRLGWTPTATNEEMLWRAYDHFVRHRSEIAARRDGSAHRRAAGMGVLRLLKWLS